MLVVRTSSAATYYSGDWLSDSFASTQLTKHYSIMRRFTKLLLYLIWLLPAISYGQSGDVMLQGFNWVSYANTQGWYNVVASKANELDQIGIDAIWMPPPSNSGAAEGYLPRQLYNVSTPYGTEAQLRSMINDLHSRNIKVLADIVVNHRVGTTNFFDFTQPAWGTWSIVNDDECNCGTGNSDFWPGSLKADGSGGGFSAARDLDHTNNGVRQGIKDWMNWLKNDIGFDGWRYDFVHGYAGNYNREYNEATNPYFAVGELLEGDRFRIIQWLDSHQGSSSAFDFATKRALHDAFFQNNFSGLRDGNGAAPGVIGQWPAKSVTMLDNHDTGPFPNQALWVFPGNRIEQGYAYILTHPGIPMVFWDHLFDYGANLRNKITDLIAVRKDNNLTATSSLNILEARNDLYVAIIDNKVAIKLGPGNWSPGAGWTLRVSGTDYAVWQQGSTPPPPPPVGGITNGIYRIEAVHSGKVVEVQGGSTANGANIQQNTWNNSNSMKWQVESLGSGNYKITNVNSNKSLDVAAFGTANGTNLHQWDYVGGNNQQWEIIAATGGNYQIRSAFNGKSLDVAGISTADGANIHLWDFVGGSNQQWKMIRLGNLREGEEILQTASQADAIAILPVPNPADIMVELRVSLPGDAPVQISILNAQGQLVETLDAPKWTSGEQSLEIDTRAYERGIYFISVEQGGQRSMQKLILR